MSIQIALHDWHDFFTVAGTSSATLMGLLFISLTLNADLMLAGDRPQLKRIAEQAFQNYIVVFLTALLFLIPHQEWRSLTTGMLIVASFMGIMTIYRIVALWRISDEYFNRAHTWRRLMPSLLGNIIMAYSAIQYRDAYSEEAMAPFAFAELTLLISATATSWDLLLRVAELRHKIGKQP